MAERVEEAAPTYRARSEHTRPAGETAFAAPAVAPRPEGPAKCFDEHATRIARIDHIVKEADASRVPGRVHSLHVLDELRARPVGIVEVVDLAAEDDVGSRFGRHERDVGRGPCDEVVAAHISAAHVAVGHSVRLADHDREARYGAVVQGVDERREGLSFVFGNRRRSIRSPRNLCARSRRTQHTAPLGPLAKVLCGRCWILESTRTIRTSNFTTISRSRLRSPDVPVPSRRYTPPGTSPL